MDDKAPQMPPPDERPQKAEDPVPNPHREEALLRQEEGVRPGADPSVRPSQDEELGPLGGLVAASGAETAEEASEVSGEGDSGAEALLAQMGVEEENIESGQLLGLVASVLVAILALATVLVFLFYIPLRTQVGLDAEGNARTTDLDIIRTEGAAKLSQYTRSDSTYGVPIARAMGLVVADYGSGDAPDADRLPDSRQEWNTLPVMRGMGQAVQDVDRSEIEPRFDDPSLRTRIIGDAPERVGVDNERVPTVDVIDNDVTDINLGDEPIE